jgi:uncharacterized FlgJ-related protein
MIILVFDAYYFVLIVGSQSTTFSSHLLILFFKEVRILSAHKWNKTKDPNFSLKKKAHVIPRSMTVTTTSTSAHSLYGWKRSAANLPLLFVLHCSSLLYSCFYCCQCDLHRHKEHLLMFHHCHIPVVVFCILE